MFWGIFLNKFFFLCLLLWEIVFYFIWGKCIFFDFMCVIWSGIRFKYLMLFVFWNLFFVLVFIISCMFKYIFNIGWVSVWSVLINVFCLMLVMVVVVVFISGKNILFVFLIIFILLDILILIFRCLRVKCIDEIFV